MHISPHSPFQNQYFTFKTSISLSKPVYFTSLSKPVFHFSFKASISLSKPVFQFFQNYISLHFQKQSSISLSKPVINFYHLVFTQHQLSSHKNGHILWEQQPLSNVFSSFQISIPSLLKQCLFPQNTSNNYAVNKFQPTQVVPQTFSEYPSNPYCILERQKTKTNNKQNT